MKFAIAVLGLAILGTVADKSSIDRQFMSHIQNSSLRAFSGNIANAINQLDEYGCWCYFYDNVGRGRGTPIDEIDQLCKNLADGYQCAILDSEAESQSCVPWEVNYSAGSGQRPGDMFANCLINNPGDNCAARACSVEGIFVDSLFAYVLSQGFIAYEDYGHKQSNFDPAIDCPVKPGVKGVSSEKACCGSYPYRFPFKTLDGDRACCGSRTYNTQLLNCCSNGQVKSNC